MLCIIYRDCKWNGYFCSCLYQFFQWLFVLEQGLVVVLIQRESYVMILVGSYLEMEDYLGC